MATVIISLGSNHRQAAHIQWASQWLQTMLTDTTCSRLLWTTDIKGSGIVYMNRLIKGTTDLSADSLNALLKAAEQRCGRQGSRVSVDLDLMQYDQQRLHLRDWPRPYIQQLINDIL